MHTSKHHTLLFLATISTECSLGEVKRSLEAGEELRAGGNYLMPETVPCNGILVFAETCAFLNRLMNTNLFRLRVALLRETNDVYDVISSTNINIISSAPNATQGCGNFTQQWPVSQGDRIGVRISDACVTSSGSMPVCPAQANLNDTASCASALYLPLGTSPLTNFRTVGVNLNVRVSIGKCALSHILLFSCNYSICLHYTAVPTASPPPLQSTCIIVSPTPLQSSTTGKNNNCKNYLCSAWPFVQCITLQYDCINLLNIEKWFGVVLWLLHYCSFGAKCRICYSTGCSLGKVEYSLENSQNLRAGGIYLMPEVVPCNGMLFFVETCAFFNRLMDTNLFRLTVGLFREGDGVYQMVHQRNIRITSQDTKGCKSIQTTRDQGWPVNQGDRIGVIIMDMCDTSSGSMPACPAQANLINTASCASALYLPLGTSPLTNFRTVGVNLNVRVSIGKCIVFFTHINSLLNWIFSIHYWTEFSPTEPTGPPAYLSSSSISKSGHESGTEISHGEIGGIVVAALAVISAIVILLTISACVYWKKVLKKHKGKYKYSERVESQSAAVVSYHLSKNDASHEEPTENMMAKGSVNKCTNSNSTDSSYKMSFRNRGVSFIKAVVIVKLCHSSSTAVFRSKCILSDWWGG